MVGLTATSDAQGEMHGTIDGPGCTDLQAQRVQ
jgi:hypothetical protein